VEQLQQFGFVQGYVIASLVAFFAFGMTFLVGARRGVGAGVRWFLGVRTAYAAVLIALTVWGAVSGQLGRFASALGLSVLLEIALFMLIWIGIMYFMASRYLSTKYRDEKAQVGSGA